MREVELTPTRGPQGKLETNEPVRIYDTSGPWGDPEFAGDVAAGLPPLRAEWIQQRKDVEAYEGRATPDQENGPVDNGPPSSSPPRLAKRKPLRAAAGHPVTQLYYARQGIVTPEMEFVAIRENQGLDQRSRAAVSRPRN